jgi:hypothetical protein
MRATGSRYLSLAAERLPERDRVALRIGDHGAAHDARQRLDAAGCEPSGGELADVRLEVVDEQRERRGAGGVGDQVHRAAES